MQKIAIKFIIAMLCIGLAAEHLDYNSVAIAALFALSVSFAIELADKKISTALYLAFFASCLFYKDCIYMVPLVVFSTSKTHKYSVAAPLVALVALRANYILIIASVLIYFIDRQMASLQQCQNELYKVDDLFRLKIKENDINKLKLMQSKDKDIDIAILSERNRIAREIHDSVGHTISAAIIQTEAMRASGDEALGIQIDGLQQNLKRGMAEIRSSLHGLHDRSIDLKLELEKITTSSAELSFELNYKLYADFSYKAKKEIISVIKESIANSIKHADASVIKISLIEMPEHIHISIEDNAVLGEADKAITDGIGFTSFQEFAKAYNGRFSYEAGQHVKLMFLLDKKAML